MDIFGFRITVKKIKRKRAKGFTSRAWSESETNAALRMRGEGMSYADIGKELHRTASAIQVRLSKVRQGIVSKNEETKIKG